MAGLCLLYPKLSRPRDWAALPPEALPYRTQTFWLLPLLELWPPNCSTWFPSLSSPSRLLLLTRLRVMATLVSPRCPCFWLCLPFIYNFLFHKSGRALPFLSSRSPPSAPFRPQAANSHKCRGIPYRPAGGCHQHSMVTAWFSSNLPRHFIFSACVLPIPLQPPTSWKSNRLPSACTASNLPACGLCQDSPAPMAGWPPSQR